MSPRSRMAVVAGAALTTVSLISGCGPDDEANGQGGGSSSESSAARAKLLHRVPMPEVSKMADAKGMWTTDRNFVKAGLKRVSGYPLEGGRTQWQIPLGGEICWSSPEPTEDGLVAVVFENGKADPATCTEVGLVDLNKGKLLWKKRAMDDGSAMDFDEVTIGGGTVAAGGTGGTAGWTVRGKGLWGAASEEKCPAEAYAGGGDKLIAVRDCGSSDRPKLRVETVNPRTRTPKSAFTLPTGTEHVSIASTDPLVLAADNGKSKGGSSVTSFLAVDDSKRRGQLLSTISMAGGGEFGKYDPDCPATEVTDCQQFVISKQANALYLPSQDSSTPDSDARNDIVGFSLKTGKKIVTAEGSDDGLLTPIGLTPGGDVLAYQQSGFQRGGAAWKISPDGKKTKLFQNPASSAKTEASFEVGDNRVRYAGKRLYFGADEISEPSGSAAETDPLAAVFGPK